MATVGSALLRDVVSQDRLGRAMGFSSLAITMALLLGPVVGGLLYEHVGYFETFLPALVLIAVEIGLRVLLIETGTREGNSNGEREPGKTDEEEGSGGSERTDIDTETTPLIPNAPTPPPHSTQNVYRLLLTTPRFLTALAALLILHSTANGFDAVLPPYINATFSLGPTHSAILFLALALPTLLSPLTGTLTDRLGAKPVAATGLAIAAPSLAALSLVGPATAAPMARLFGNLFGVGVGLALSLVPLVVDATAAVGAMEAERPGVFGQGGAYARAFGLVNAVVAAGGMVGPLGAGYLRVGIGWAGLAWVMGGLCLGAWGAVMLFTGGRRKEGDGGEGKDQGEGR